MEGGTDLIAARLEIIIVGNVINVSTRPPTSGTERGTPKKLMNIAKPSKPKIIEGTAARLLTFTSIKSVHLFFGVEKLIPMGYAWLFPKAEHITVREEDYFQGYNYASWAGADI